MNTPIVFEEEIKRKLVHLSSLWMVLATLLIPSQLVRCILFALLLVLTLIAEHDYANNGAYLGKLYGRLFGRMLRNEVRPGQWIVSGAAPVLAAALLVNCFFMQTIAAISMTILLTGDAAAAIVGRKWGRHKLVNGKTLEGTLAFIAAAYIVSALVLLCMGILQWCWLWILPAVIGGAVIELFQKQLKLDDNLLIPLVSGVILLLTIGLC